MENIKIRKIVIEYKKVDVFYCENQEENQLKY